MSKVTAQVLAMSFKEKWGTKLNNAKPKKCSHCKDTVTYRNAFKRDRFFYCSPECSIAKDAELAILEEAISLRRKMKDVEVLQKA